MKGGNAKRLDPHDGQPEVEAFDMNHGRIAELYRRLAAIHCELADAMSDETVDDRPVAAPTAPTAKKVHRRPVAAPEDASLTTPDDIAKARARRDLTRLGMMGRRS